MVPRSQDPHRLGHPGGAVSGNTRHSFIAQCSKYSVLIGQFSELAITADTEEGINVGIVTVKNGQRSVKYVILASYILVKTDHVT